jgi:tRNA_anti-like
MVAKISVRVGVWGLLTWAFLAASGCGKSDSGSSSKGDTDQGTAKPKDTNKAADVALDAKAWHAEWKKDKAATAKKYQGKVIELSGVVAQVESDPTGQGGFVFLEVAGDALGVQCATVDKEPWAKVSTGSSVKVRGTIPDKASIAYLVNCVITEAGANPAVAIDGPKLAREVAADPKAAKAKYDEKWAILTGEVAGKQGDSTLIVKGDGDVQIPCNFVAPDNKAIAPLKAGDKAKVFGRLNVAGDAKKVSLGGSLLITK